jgi:hypothetical protein
MQVKYEPWVIKTNDQEVWGIKITDGKYNGTSFSINELDIEDGNKDLQLDYTVIASPEGIAVEEVKGPEFEKVLNEIMTDIITKAVDEYENRKSNSPESGE